MAGKEWEPCVCGVVATFSNSGFESFTDWVQVGVR